MSTLDYQLALMPATIQRVAALATPALAIRFARRFGGQKIYVPKRVYSAHPLVKCLGWAAAQRLCAEFGGEDWAVPSASNYLTWLDARALRVCGLSNPDVARKLGITVRHVHRLLAGFEPDDVEVTDLVRSIARRYAVRPQVRSSVAPLVEDKQASFAFPADSLGMRLTEC